MLSFKNCSAAFVTALAALVLCTGCDRRTPQERLQTAAQFYQQGDQLSAEMEALKVVEKAPDEPEGIQASMLLAQIYSSQNRNEEAELQLESALKNVSQKEPMGKEALRLYLGVLNNQKNYKKALEVVDQYQKEYADDPGTSLSLTVASADIHTAAGETTQARAILQNVVEETTAPAELSLYRELIARTYMRDKDTTGAIEYMEKELAQVTDPGTKQNIMLILANLYGGQENYEKSRSYLEAVTADFSQDVRKELDNRARLGMSIQLAQVYQSLGNLPGARRILQAVYDTNTKDPQLLMPTVMGLAENLLRQGETSATESFLQEAAQKYPDAHFDQQLKKLQELSAKGELQNLAPQDTSTLTMKYKADQNVLWPSDLPSILESETTGTQTSEELTTGTKTATETETTSAPAEAATSSTL